MSLTESATSSQYLSSSISSLHGPRSRVKRPNKTSSEISKTYKHASQLYLTRRLVECYDTLQSVVRPAATENGEGRIYDQSPGEDESSRLRAPIAAASTSYRIKTWVLYTTLLSAIIELGEEEGKKGFGTKRYREIVRCVQTGDIWEQVVRNGYAGREGAVDAEVVYNLSNLLLAHAPDQILNQSRLETYLSTSLHGSLDLSAAIYNGINGHQKHHSSGIDTPKDLNSRIKILELFILHVLPANNEWDYAKSFIRNSDILEEERREALLQTLIELQEAREQEERELQAEREEDLVGFAEQTEDEEASHDKIYMHENEHDNGVHLHNGQDTRKHSHRRTGSEIDYGIEDTLRPPSSIKQSPQSPQSSYTAAPPSVTQSTSSAPTVPPPSTASLPSSESRSLPPVRRHSKQQSPKPPAKIPPIKKGRIASVLQIMRNLSNLLSQSLTRNPTVIFRTIMFLFAFLLVLAKRDVRERLRRVLEQGWGKMLATAKMGGKISYI